MRALVIARAAGWITALAILGPGAVRAGDNVWTPLGSDSSVTALAIDPRNSTTVYAASAAGLFTSTDGGATWSAMNPGPPCCVSALLADPQIPGVLYGLARVANGSVNGQVLKSSDGGATWTPANAGLPIDPDGRFGVASLAVDSRNPGTLYAGNALPGGGVFKTTNGGEYWRLASAGLPDSGVMALAIDPQAPDTVYASTQSGGLFRSADGGASWSGINSGLSFAITHGYDYVSALAIDPQNPDTLYTAPHLIQDDVEDRDPGLYKSTNAGATWTPINIRNVIALAIDPQNGGTVFAATYGGVYKSADAGAHWTPVKNRAQSDAGGAMVISALALDPQNPSTVYAAAVHSGIFKSTDAGANWDIVNSGLIANRPAGVLSLRIDPQNAGTIWAVTSFGVFKSVDSGTNWSPMNAGLAQFGNATVSTLEIDPQNSDTLYALSPSSPALLTTTNGGAYWGPVNAAVFGSRLYASALAVDPRTPHTLYAAGLYGQPDSRNSGTGVLKTTDGGASWIPVNTGLPPSSPGQDVVATSLAIDPQNPNSVYAGIGFLGLQSRGSVVFKSTSGGFSWRDVGLSGYSRADILAIDPGDANIVYARTARLGCCGSPALFKTTSGGGDWSAVEGLPAYVDAVAIDPRNSNTVYAATDSGVFQSADGGATWSAMNSGLTNLSVTTLTIDPKDPDTLYTGTADGVFAIRFVH